MKTWSDLDAKTRDFWRSQEATGLALDMLRALQKHFGERTIAEASNADVESTSAIRFNAGVHEGLRLAISQLTTEPKAK